MQLGVSWSVIYMFEFVTLPNHNRTIINPPSDPKGVLTVHAAHGLWGCAQRQAARPRWTPWTPSFAGNAGARWRTWIWDFLWDFLWDFPWDWLTENDVHLEITGGYREWGYLSFCQKPIELQWLPVEIRLSELCLCNLYIFTDCIVRKLMFPDMFYHISYIP